MVPRSHYVQPSYCFELSQNSAISMSPSFRCVKLSHGFGLWSHLTILPLARVGDSACRMTTHQNDHNPRCKQKARQRCRMTLSSRHRQKQSFGSCPEDFSRLCTKHLLRAPFLEKELWHCTEEEADKLKRRCIRRGNSRSRLHTHPCRYTTHDSKTAQNIHRKQETSARTVPLKRIHAITQSTRFSKETMKQTRTDRQKDRQSYHNHR